MSAELIWGISGKMMRLLVGLAVALPLTLGLASSASATGIVSINFDDLPKDQIDGLKVAQKYGIKVSLGAIVDTMVNPKDYIDDDGFRYYMLPAELKGALNKGHELVCHTNTHADLPTLSPRGIRQELTPCKTLAKMFGRPTATKLLFYPYGDRNQVVIQQTKALGFTTARTVDAAVNSAAYVRAHPYEILAISPDRTTSLKEVTDLIDIAAATDGLVNATFHHTKGTCSPKVPEDEFCNTLSFLEAVFKYGKGKGVQFLPYGEAFMAMKARTASSSAKVAEEAVQQQPLLKVKTVNRRQPDLHVPATKRALIESRRGR